jgi:hypothetical protein
MAKENSRVRINLQTGEFEIEGSEEFINEQARRLKTLVKNLKEAAEATTAPATKAAPAARGRRAAAPAAKAAAPAKKAAKPAAKAAKKAAPKPAAKARKAAPKKAAAPAVEGVKEFSSLLKKLPEKVSDVDRLLLAGYFLQSGSGDHTFSTRDANRLLDAAGAKIRNAAQAAKANINAKRLVKVDRGQFRFTDEGLAYVKNLVGA